MKTLNIERQPVDAATGEPLEPRPQPGYYPGFSTLDQQKTWDDATRKVVLERVSKVAQTRFFSPEEAALLTLLCEHAIPQDDRTADRRIPIVPDIDERLFLGKSVGYRFDNMPPDGEAYRIALRAIEASAREVHHGHNFADLSWADQELLLESIHESKPRAPQCWRGLDAERFWMMFLSDCAEAYYSHPWAWDEVGFGGPAYPRAYFRLERGEPEPWEVEEKRYEWVAPPASRSDRPRDTSEPHVSHPHHGQGGTH